MSVASKARLIGLDWGTSSLRAYLLGERGKVLDSLHSSEGIMHVQNNAFESTLHRFLEPWLQGARLPVVASGMITSRNGWHETPYLTVPTNANDLAKALAERKHRLSAP